MSHDPSSAEPSHDATISGPDVPETRDVHELHAQVMREHDEPRDGLEPIPFWMTAVFGALLAFGGWYMATYSGGYRADVFDDRPRTEWREPAGQSKDSVALGQQLYAHCQGCHQSNGQGVPGQFPPLAHSSWVTGNPARLTRIVLHGLHGPITVNGTLWPGTYQSPPFGVILDDRQIADLLTYLRQEWGHQASPVTPEMVAATRAAVQQSGRSPGPWTEKELLALPETHKD